MRSLKRITIFFILLYVFFILINALEFGWNEYVFTHRKDFLQSERLRSFSLWMRWERSLHLWLNLLAYLTQFLFLIICNRFVRRNNLGKGYHFLLVLLAFFPIANWFLLYMIWRKLNKNIFIYLGRSFKRVDQLIILIWISTLIGAVSPFFVPLFSMYSNSSESVSMAMNFSYWGSLIHSIYLLIVSLLYLFYFLGFRRAIQSMPISEEIIRESQLLDG